METIYVTTRPHVNSLYQGFVVSIPEHFIRKNNLFDSLSSALVSESTREKCSKLIEQTIVNICDKFSINEYSIKII